MYILLGAETWVNGLVRRKRIEDLREMTLVSTSWGSWSLRILRKSHSELSKGVSLETDITVLGNVKREQPQDLLQPQHFEWVSSGKSILFLCKFILDDLLERGKKINSHFGPSKEAQELPYLMTSYLYTVPSFPLEGRRNGREYIDLHFLIVKMYPCPRLCVFGCWT